jgi:hypothetical protein
MLVRHGSVFQIQNPWSTSLYGAVWQQSIPRDIVLGCTIGEAYTQGLSHVGNLYLGESNDDENSPQLWWDNSQNIVCYGDPNLKLFVPNTEYSDSNYWTENDVVSLTYNKNYNVNGHTPFGATEYPHAKSPKSFFEKYLSIMLLIIIVILIIISFIVYFLRKRRGKNEK